MKHDRPIKIAPTKKVAVLNAPPKKESKKGIKLTLKNINYLEWVGDPKQIQQFQKEFNKLVSDFNDGVEAYDNMYKLSKKYSNQLKIQTAQNIGVSLEKLLPSNQTSRAINKAQQDSKNLIFAFINAINELLEQKLQNNNREKVLLLEAVPLKKLWTKENFNTITDLFLTIGRKYESPLSTTRTYDTKKPAAHQMQQLKSYCVLTNSTIEDRAFMLVVKDHLMKFGRKYEIDLEKLNIINSFEFLLLDTDLSSIDKNGDTSLHRLARDKNTDLDYLTILIAQGADINIKNKNGETVKEYLIKEGLWQEVEKGIEIALEVQKKGLGKAILDSKSKKKLLNMNDMPKELIKVFTEQEDFLDMFSEKFSESRESRFKG